MSEPTVVANVAIVATAVRRRTVRVGRSYSGAGIIPETAVFAVMKKDTVKQLFTIVVLVVCCELLIVVVQKTVAAVLTGVIAGVAAVVTQQQSIFVSQ